MSTINDCLLLRAIRKEPVERTPIWIMRQAGRYLPEYIALKNKSGGFINLIKNPDLACEITLQPLKRFSLDSAILFSDILVISDVFGIKLSFEENKGPVFDKTINSFKDLKNIINGYEIDRLDYVFKAIKLIKHELNGKSPLIGFIGSPWTVATYFIEGNSTKKFHKVFKMLDTNKELVHALLEEITKVSIKYINAQILSGIDVVMIFDTWGGLLEGEMYKEFSINYVNKIRDSISSSKTPIIYYVRDPKNKAGIIKNLNVDVVGIDSTVDIGEFKRLVGSKFTLQGNLDVNILKLSDKEIHHEVENILESYNGTTGHIFNLGTGITPDINPDKLKTLIEILANISPKYNVK